MIKMGKTKYHYNRKDYTAKALVALFDHPKKGRKFSRNLGCYYVTVDVEFAGRKVRLFFTKRNKKSEWNALITTNTELEFKEAYRIYSMRWSLEVVFKDSKRQSWAWQVSDAQLCFPHCMYRNHCHAVQHTCHGKTILFL